MTEQRENSTGRPSRIWEKKKTFADYIYQHLVGVRLVCISRPGCDPKSTQAGLSHAALLTPPSSAS